MHYQFCPKTNYTNELSVVNYLLMFAALLEEQVKLLSVGNGFLRELEAVWQNCTDPRVFKSLKKMVDDFLFRELDFEVSKSKFMTAFPLSQIFQFDGESNPTQGTFLESLNFVNFLFTSKEII